MSSHLLALTYSLNGVSQTRVLHKLTNAFNNNLFVVLFLKRRDNSPVEIFTK
jgi:hypothetical protein